MLIVPVRPGLEMRLYQDSHAQELFDVVVANRDHLNQWLPWPDSHKTTEDTRDFIHRSWTKLADPQISLGIFEDNRIVGGIGTHLRNAIDRNVSIGYWLVKDACGRGLMTTCCERLVRYCFMDLDVHRVWLEAAVGNLPSQGVAQRIGMTQEGITRDSHLVHGQWLSMTIWSILRPEWEARQTAP
ncbi:MAG: GNAT family protein [bacterium]